MYNRKSSAFVIFWALFAILHRQVEAGPMKRLSRMVREVYPEIEPENEGNQAQVCIVGEVVYGTEESVPADQPCLKCRCQPPGVQCETIQCVKKPGCKAIHGPNKCCPDYQCECEHNGKIYANGEKLETPPGGECKVCYCRGGEVQCAEVSCYMRKDCEGKRVPGKCCPKYDHCPPIESVPDRNPYTTELSNPDKDSFEPWPIIGLSQNSTEGILSPTLNDIQDENRIPDTNYFEATTQSYKATEVDDLQKEKEIHHSKITIQEIIPERKEIPITASPKLENEPHGTLIIEETEELLNNTNDLIVTDADADSSEISEVFQQPPPVLRIGDKLLFLKKGEFVPEKDTSTPNAVITIIGAEGLQRGFEDSLEVHEVKIENLPINKHVSTLDPIGTTNSTDLQDQQKNEHDANTVLETVKNINDIELNTAASTHILSLVKRKNKPSITTQAPISSATTESTKTFDGPTSADSNIIPEVSTSSSTSIQEILNTSTEKLKEPQATLKTLLNEETKNATENTPLNDTSATSAVTKNCDVITEQDPAYPPLPDIMSPNMDDTSQRFDIENTEQAENATVPTLKILPEVLEIRNNRTVPQNITNSEWLKGNPDTLINYKATLPDEILNQPAASDYEDTTEVVNSTEFSSTESEILTASESKNYVTVTSELSIPEDVTKLDNLAVITGFSVVTESLRSIETLEDHGDSDERTTPKNKRASMITNEDASVENLNKEVSEAIDMVLKEAPDDTSKEYTTKLEVELIDNVESTKNGTKNVKDVEIIDTTKLQKGKPIEKTLAETTTTPEILPKPEKLQLPSKVIDKRESSAKDEEDEVFKELEQELNPEDTGRNLDPDEEQRESDDIFRQLLEDTSTPRSRKPSSESRNKDSEALQRVSDALAQLAFSGKKPDSNILGVLTNFFSSQYRSYNRK